LDDVESGLTVMGVWRWRKIVRDRDAWKLIQKEANALHGPYSQWRESETAEERETETERERLTSHVISLLFSSNKLQK
jgi:hypothetical protein